jgi:hypothetical protein
MLPAMVVRWLDLPLAHGGQYYRCIILAHLGLAGMLAGSRTTAGTTGWLWAGLGVASIDALRTVAMFGMPWQTLDLPMDVWEQWARDPVPGAVAHVPMFSQHLIPCHPIRLAGRTVHGRALADMPRSWVEPPEDPLVSQLARCTRRGNGCDLPPLDELGAAGFRYAVMDLPMVSERSTLERRLIETWGDPDGTDGFLVWWVIDPRETSP